MDKHGIHLQGVLFLLLLVAAPLHAASVTEDLFQKALLRESVDRDPEGAIHLYQQVLDQPGVSLALSAEVRLRMGICFEKLGKPLEAERFYRQILSQSSGASSTILHQTRNNLGRIEAEHPVVLGDSSMVQDASRNRYIPTRFSFLLGPSLLASSRATPATSLSIGFRFRISPNNQSYSWFLEAHGTTPLGDSKVADQAETFGSQGTDSASLSFKYQTSLGLVGELPHGQQRKLIPEAGIGTALTSAKISYSNASSSGDQTQKILSPYVDAGLHFFPDRVFSGIFRVRYVTTPYSNSVDTQSPPHSQNFNFPSSLWDVGLTLQIKIGRFVRVPRS